jgi:hypothetical protein
LLVNLVEVTQFSRDRDHGQLCLYPDTIPSLDIVPTLMDVEHVRHRRIFNAF